MNTKVFSQIPVASSIGELKSLVSVNQADQDILITKAQLEGFIAGKITAAIAAIPPVTPAPSTGGTAEPPFIVNLGPDTPLLLPNTGTTAWNPTVVMQSDFAGWDNDTNRLSFAVPGIYKVDITVRLTPTDEYGEGVIWQFITSGSVGTEIINATGLTNMGIKTEHAGVVGAGVAEKFHQWTDTHYIDVTVADVIYPIRAFWDLAGQAAVIGILPMAVVAVTKLKEHV